MNDTIISIVFPAWAETVSLEKLFRQIVYYLYPCHELFYKQYEWNHTEMNT